MIFNSVTFLLFLAIVTALYWVLPRRPRLLLLMTASLTFYGFWRVEFLPVMLLSAATDYTVSLRLPQTSKTLHRRLLLITSLVVNLGLLFYFKYLMFFLGNVQSGANLLGIDWQAPELQIILPLGISFYTFQTISYTVDVYRGFIEPERDPVLYTTYVTFFPQLVAGPVLRAREVVGQLSSRPRFRSDDLSYGLRRVLAGLFLKTVVADNIAPLVDAGFAAEASSLSALDVWTLAFLFGFQIYFDFSAYSHIALGVGRMMGIHFPENFNFPYLATSPREFWKRWHISLSSWIRDYLYLPLAGEQVLDRSTGGLDRAVEMTPQKDAGVDDAMSQRRRAAKRTRALFVTWAIMGLWHGSAWRFVVWGIYHSVLVYGHRRLARVGGSLPGWLRRGGGWAITLPLAMLNWIPFRAPTLADTLTLWSKLFQPRAYLWLGMRENTYIITALLLLAMLAVYFARQPMRSFRDRRPWAGLAVDGVGLACVFGLVFVFLRPISQFIYFQF